MAFAEAIVKCHVIEIVILLWCGFLVFFYLKTKNLTKEMEECLWHKHRLANQPEMKSRPLKGVEKQKFEDKVVKTRKQMNKYYVLYANFTSVLPLLGMLGTVMSLFTLAGKMGQEELPIDNFFSALLTTILGLIGAIVFKSMDSGISVGVAENNKETDTYLERNTDEKKQQKQEVKQS